MPRTLGDVIDCFIPEAASSQPERARSRARKPAHCASIALPVARGDVLRAAVAWNLSVEISRAGAPCTLAIGRRPEDTTLWPPPGPGPLGSRLVEIDAGSALDPTALPADGPPPAVLLACAESEELSSAAVASAAPQRWLLLTSPDSEELRRAHAQALAIAQARPDARIGVTVHGVRRVAEARAAFEKLAHATEQDAGLTLLSYGLLVDDLHLYRAIVAQRPIGLAHPAAPATRALADVAQLLLEDTEAERT